MLCICVGFVGDKDRVIHSKQHFSLFISKVYQLSPFFSEGVE